MRTRLPLQGLTITAALVLGFGLTLGLWVIEGYAFTRRIAAVQSDSAAVNERYMRAQEALSTIRGEVLLCSVYVRDAFLNPDLRATEDHRLRLTDSFAAVDGALQTYVSVLDTEEEWSRVGQLRRETDEFQSTMLEVLRADPSRGPGEELSLLNDLVLPLRAAIIRVAEEAQALNRSAFLEQQRRVSATYEELQDGAWRRLGVGLAISLGIALIAIGSSGRLEYRLRRQLEKDARNTRDLRDLSAQLIRVQEEERRTIARELHDEVGQVILAMKVELAYARRAIAARGGPEPVLDEAERIADGALRVVRNLSQLLHPALLDDLGLAAAVNSYVEGFSRRHSLEVNLQSEGLDEHLPSHIEAAAFRIVQEGLTNVAKHAQAATCLLALRRTDDHLLITIEDDGVGFDATESKRTQRGLGLIGIRERVAQLQGTLRLESGPDIGTSVRVVLPVEVPAAAATTDAVTAAAPATLMEGVHE